MSYPEKILIVDDEAPIRNLLSAFLSVEGFNITLAEDGLDSLDKMKNSNFDLVITDINMPRMDGIELLKTMRRNARKEKIIIMTGQSFSRPLIRKEIPPVAAILMKPFHMSMFIDTVFSVLYAGKRDKRFSRVNRRGKGQ